MKQENDSRLYRYGQPISGTDKAKMHFEMRPTPSFSPLRFKSYSEAVEAIKDFGVTDKDAEYFDYWEDQRNQCVVVRVQQVEDVVHNSEDSRFAKYGNISAVKQRLQDAQRVNKIGYDTKYVNNHTRAGRDGKQIICPLCDKWTKVFHFSWSALECNGCHSDVEKKAWIVK